MFENLEVNVLKGKIYCYAKMAMACQKYYQKKAKDAIDKNNLGDAEHYLDKAKEISELTRSFIEDLETLESLTT